MPALNKASLNNIFEIISSSYSLGSDRVDCEENKLIHSTKGLAGKFIFSRSSNTNSERFQDEMYPGVKKNLITLTSAFLASQILLLYPVLWRKYSLCGFMEFIFSLKIYRLYIFLTMKYHVQRSWHRMVIFISIIISKLDD